jgi:hypothetical protein
MVPADLRRGRGGEQGIHGDDAGGGAGGDYAAAFNDGAGEIWRGIFAVCGFSDNTFVVLVVRAPTGKIHRYRTIHQIFHGNIPLLPLNLSDRISFNLSSFEFKPLVANKAT